MALAAAPSAARAAPLARATASSSRLLGRSTRRAVCRSQRGDEAAPVSRSDVLRLGLLVAGTGYVGRELLQDLGVTQGEANEKADPYEGVQGVGTKYKTAIFAGGCFWCMEPAFDDVPGVLATVSGYTGGSADFKDPSYIEVSSGVTGHAEAVQVVYDPSVCSYDDLLDAFFHNIDPTTVDRQFVDAGTQYRSAIFYGSDEERDAARTFEAKLGEAGVFGAPIVTEVTAAGPFWPAEQYHQNYYKTHAQRYGVYRSLSGRDEFIQQAWGVDYWQKHHAH